MGSNPIRLMRHTHTRACIHDHRVSPPGYKPPAGRVGATVRGGDLLLSNHTSLLEVLYFASRFSPLSAGAAAVAPEVSETSCPIHT